MSREPKPEDPEKKRLREEKHYREMKLKAKVESERRVESYKENTKFAETLTPTIVQAKSLLSLLKGAAAKLVRLFCAPCDIYSFV